MMNQMGRGALQVTVRANSRDVHLITAHLKSKLLTFPGGLQPRRRGRARPLRRLRALPARLRSNHAPRPPRRAPRRTRADEMAVVLMGDMNDELDAATTLILNGPPGSEIGSVGFDQPDQGDGDRMWNPAPLIPRRPSGSHGSTAAGMELIDHIFVSHFLVTGTRTTDVTTVTAPQGMPSIEDDPNARIGKPGSDHAALVATFDF